MQSISHTLTVPRAAELSGRRRCLRGLSIVPFKVCFGEVIDEVLNRPLIVAQVVANKVISCRPWSTLNR
jgi:hypothetical protein